MRGQISAKMVIISLSTMVSNSMADDGSSTTASSKTEPWRKRQNSKTDAKYT